MRRLTPRMVKCHAQNPMARLEVKSWDSNPDIPGSRYYVVLFVTSEVQHFSNLFVAFFPYLKAYFKWKVFFFFFNFLTVSWPGILVPQLGIKPVPTALKRRSLNHWTPFEGICIFFCSDCPRNF